MAEDKANNNTENAASESVTAILHRLRRLEGQVQGLQRMIEQQRDCSDIVTQCLAARAALEEATALIMEQEIDHCLNSPNPQKERAAKMLRLCLRYGR